MVAKEVILPGQELLLLPEGHIGSKAKH
jgi:hypothetical protein